MKPKNRELFRVSQAERITAGNGEVLLLIVVPTAPGPQGAFPLGPLLNHVLAFPGIFRGAIDVQATSITEGMQLAAADALAALVVDDLREDLLIPGPFDPRVGPAAAAAANCPPRGGGLPRPQRY